MRLNGVLIGSENPKALSEYYSKIFGKPGWDGGGYTGWQIGEGGVTVGPHDQVKGKNAHPGRIIWGIETSDVKGDFEKFKAAGATVVKEPYEPEMDPETAAEMEMPEGTEMWIATFSDPDDNYFQLMSPMGKQE